MKGYPFSPWFRSIISLMDEFDNVYADLSFSGTNPEFYTRLSSFIESMEDEQRQHFENRILFGSDFSVNLLKVESYTEYFSIFEHSVFTEEQIEKFVSINPIEFMGLKNTSSLLPWKN